MSEDRQAMGSGGRDAGERDRATLPGQCGPGEHEMPRRLGRGVVRAGRRVGAVPDVTEHAESTCRRQVAIRPSTVASLRPA